MPIDRREFLTSSALAALGLLLPDRARSVGRSMPPVPTTDEIFGWARDVVEITGRHPQFRRSGSPGDAEVRAYIASQLRSFGIESVEDQTYTAPERWYDEWSLVVAGRDVPCFFWRSAAFTKPEGLTAPALYVGDTVPLDGSVRGKIVVMNMRPGEIAPPVIAAISDYVHDPDGSLVGTAAFPAPNLSSNFPVSFYLAHEQGAVGLVGILEFPTGTNEFYPDVGLAVRDLMPAVLVGQHDGERLARDLSAAGSAEATIRLLGRAGPKSQSGNVVATLPGCRDEVIVVNTHHDSCFTGAVEDASGVACVLALARFYAAYTEDLRIRTLVFDFEGSHWAWDYPLGSRRFFERNPAVIEQAVACLGIEHVARDVRVEDGHYVPTGETAPTLLFAPAQAELKRIAIEAVKANDLRRSFIPRFGGEDLMIPAQTRWFHMAGIPVYQYITGPEYLYLSDDTLDKIDRDRLVPVVSTFIQLIERLQYIPRERMRPGA